MGGKRVPGGGGGWESGGSVGSRTAPDETIRVSSGQGAASFSRCTQLCGVRLN